MKRKLLVVIDGKNRLKTIEEKIKSKFGMNFEIDLHEEMCNLKVKNEEIEIEYNFSIGSNMSGTTLYMSYFEKEENSASSKNELAKEVTYVVLEWFIEEAKKEYAVISFAPSENLIEEEKIKSAGLDEVFEYAYGKKYFFNVRKDARKTIKQVDKILEVLKSLTLEDTFFVQRLRADFSYMPLMHGNALRVKVRYEGFSFELHMKNVNGDILLSVYKDYINVIGPKENRVENFDLLKILSDFVRDMRLKNLLIPPVKEMKNLLSKRIYLVDKDLPDESQKEYVEIYKKIEFFLKENFKGEQSISVLNFLEKVVKKEDAEIVWKTERVVITSQSSLDSIQQTKKNTLNVILKYKGKETQFDMELKNQA